MNGNKEQTYQCPICRNTLKRGGNEYCCESNHHFDIAKEGYVNLLLPNQKSSKNPGDDKSMLVARREFLNSGCYDRLVEEIVNYVKTLPQYRNVLDIACGEGFYTNKIYEQLNSEYIFGLDISKHAIQLASKKYKQINFCVASSENLPYLNESFDLAISIFAPFNLPEVMRILTNKGIFIVVGPNTEHLKELAGVIYENIKPHQMEIIKVPEVNLIEQKKLKYVVQISEKDIINLWKMSPYFWHTREGVEDKVKNIKKITLDFRIDIYEKK